ncbi:hypothetical protein BUALT_Bualt02G0197900 [Buddleja alternifolia]|uniref:(S)-ureidoglycine aminohydrolase cupin domain-containing protein n=1 Tax=Buddleja alternifolia TaxID=168488 RepID=A0AAV6Y9N0_9LAMI|nr:hypothetical protein BUALT_Bualt02G0197900 [Buddleja alternifolia]
MCYLLIYSLKPIYSLISSKNSEEKHERMDLANFHIFDPRSDGFAEFPGFTPVQHGSAAARCIHTPGPAIRPVLGYSGRTGRSGPGLKTLPLFNYVYIFIYIQVLLGEENPNLIYIMAAESSNSSNLKIIVQKAPSESQLSELGIKYWPKWGCPPGKYQLKFDAQETCYLVRGKVKVYPKNSESEEVVEFGAGDLVVIPKGLSCTWDVSVAVDKHYKFETS